MAKRFLQVFFGILAVSVFVWIATREPKRPELPRWRMQEALLEQASKEEALRKRRAADVVLVKGLLNEELSDRWFSFGVVAEAVSGKKVIPSKGRSSTGRVVAAIDQVMAEILPELSGEASPVRELRRINEASGYFEEAMLEALNKLEGVRCEVPVNREGKVQRSGYPDLKITDVATGDVFYLDPKLMEKGSIDSTLRTFYFEPKNHTLKITEDASHLLIGIEHDGNDGNWEFLGYRLVDLAFLQVRLKAEFQASNKNIYTERSVLETDFRTGKDGQR
jgi:hypothetical protein